MMLVGTLPYMLQCIYCMAGCVGGLHLLYGRMCWSVASALFSLRGGVYQSRRCQLR